jgi:putative membrane protein insertion efficiency factor
VTSLRSLRGLARRAVRLPALAVVGLLRLWQLLISPVYGQTCRFYPSCTAYAMQAVDRHGLVRGGWLAVRRLARCHPWNPGGVDHVPARRVRVSAEPAQTTPANVDVDADLDASIIPAAPVADHRPPRRAA